IAFVALLHRQTVCRAEKTIDFDELLLSEAGVSTDGASLIALLNKHAGSDTDLQNLKTLIGQLGSQNFEEREQASKRLIALGAPAVYHLHRAIADPDAEVRKRAKVCLTQIASTVNLDVPAAAVRLIVRRGSPEAVAALLRY